MLQIWLRARSKLGIADLIIGNVTGKITEDIIEYSSMSSSQR